MLPIHVNSDQSDSWGFPYSKILANWFHIVQQQERLLLLFCNFVEKTFFPCNFASLHEAESSLIHGAAKIGQHYKFHLTFVLIHGFNPGSNLSRWALRHHPKRGQLRRQICMTFAYPGRRPCCWTLKRLLTSCAGFVPRHLSTCRSIAWTLLSTCQNSLCSSLPTP